MSGLFLYCLPLLKKRKRKATVPPETDAAAQTIIYSQKEFSVDFYFYGCIINSDRNLSKGCDRMKNRKILAFLAAFAILFAFAGCTVEFRNPNELPPEDVSVSGNPEQETEDTPPEEIKEPEQQEFPEEPEGGEKNEDGTYKFMSFEEITELGYYPLYMQPHTYIIYDENGVPEIVEGGVITEEESVGREDLAVIGYYDPLWNIKPNTKVEYDLWGFMQNIYYLWPDGSYNLSPYSQTENARITYYENIEEYEQDKGEMVLLHEAQCHAVYWISDRMNLRPESTSEPMGFPRYKITFTYLGEEHCIYVDSNNVFTSTMLPGGNYTCTIGEDHFSDTEELYNSAK